MIKNREYYKEKIVARLLENKEELINQFKPHEEIGSFILDDLLSAEDTLEIYIAFPKPEDMKVKKSLREYKFIDAQLDDHDPILEEITYAFHSKEVMNIISDITGIKGLIPDDMLYAGGLSRMEKGQYLNPHLDNSHNKDRSLYRVVNLLFYVTPDREIKDGGNLELWDHGPSGKQRTIHSRFNRLAVMITNKKSWHSVSKVVSGNRCCVSNYYFSEKPLIEEEYFHVTTFRGFPHQKIRNIILTVDSKVRMGIRKVFKKGLVDNPHVYKK